MRLREAIRMALATVRAQKLKSFFSLIGVLIGVTFLIAVILFGVLYLAILRPHIERRA